MPPDDPASIPMPSLIPAPKRRNGPDGTPGRCTNLDYCSIGMQRVLVNVPLGEPFVCPECGGKLRPPAEGIGGRQWVLPALRILILVLGIGLGAVWGYQIGRPAPDIDRKPPAGSQNSDDAMNAARAAPGRRKQDAGSLPQVIQPATPAAQPPTYPPVQARSYPTRTMPLDAADPAQHLQNEQRFGQVTVDCILFASTATPNCHIGNVRGGDAFSAPSLAWLKNLALHYAPETRGGAPVQTDHRWRIIFEDYSGLGLATNPQASRRR